MKYALIIILLLVAGFFAQAEDSNKQGGFFSIDFGAAVNSKLTHVSYPASLSYGGNILEDRYVGAVEIGIITYRQKEFPVPHLLLKYNYDFMASNPSNWILGADTALHLGGATVRYTTQLTESSQPNIPADVDVKKNNPATHKTGINLYDKPAIHTTGVILYVGHDLGLFVKKRISKSFVVLFRGGINNALSIKPRFVFSSSPAGETESKQDKKTNDEEIEVSYDFLNPTFYLSTGIEWYL